ncbi:hypothetical protein [Pelomonas sp. SE-A7]|uniref:hypothetical protein n=1 Tax=Pelomonas sp. SE-A7 TaxID=3054953 RepID=UPI00259C7E74|nr:hypothetical protein [Pelomonas sp. SE-A7]MDM4768551.1 hypothetical protein [Pelomonas sp. SE-A7]
MNAILDAASTWFFDSATQSLDGTLEGCIVEGIKGEERQYVEVGETRLGPYFPVAVEPTSKCVQVLFPDARAFFVYDESFHQADPELRKKDGRTLFEAEFSSFRGFAASGTAIEKLIDSAVSEFVLCCEDRIIHVLSTAAPRVHLLNKQPDLSVERTQTWSAS